MAVNRSFANRSRNLSSRQKQVFEELWPKYGLNIKDGLVNFFTIFKNDLPVVLEIGFGNGDNLLNLAKTKPDFNYIGVDVYLPGVAKVITELAAQDIQNVRIYHGDVVEILSACIPNESLTKILIFFPDPWPKRRHHKRRLIQAEFVKQIIEKLKKGGALHFATDWADYASHVVEDMKQISEFTNVAGEKQFVERSDFRLLTKFELRGQKLGHQIFDLLFVKNC